MGAIVQLKSRKKPEKVAFDDVLGCDEAKEEIKQVIVVISWVDFELCIGFST